MDPLTKRARFALVAPLAVLVSSAVAGAQTFRGTVEGTVTDSSGAIVANAVVELKNPATDTTLNSRSNSAGAYSFPELAPGTYELTVSAPGFASNKVSNIDVQVTKVANIDVHLSVGTENTEIDVTAGNTIATDTETSALVAVVDNKAVQEMPMNGRDFTRMVRFAPGVAALSNSVNGQRTTSINFQVDGTDNVDAWLGIVASNQGGIASVAGGLIPIEAIDQFSMQSGGEADEGRNAGANSNMVLKSGTNSLHGDLYYFDRNEFFAAISPVNAVGAKKNFLRNHQGGFTVGGPIWKDRTFFFLAGEVQIAKINTALVDTVLSDAWLSAAAKFMGNYGYTPNQLSTNLYGLLFPNYTKGAALASNNFLPQGIANYNSFNGILKLDQNITEKHHLSLRYLGTTGKQTAPTSSDYAQYFQTAPMHIHNVSIVDNYVFSPKLLNQLTLGTNYFLQTFNDANQNFNPQQNAGLNLGLPAGSIIAAGAPTISVSGFDISGATQPSGRTDVTGHITDTLHWELGRHSLRMGGEYRHANINQLYFSNVRGNFSFDGTRGPWFTNATTKAQGTTCNATATAYAAAIVSSSVATCQQLAYVADFLRGTPSASNGAKLLQGNAQRVWLLNTEDAYAQDDFKVSKKLNVNFGVRYTVPGVVTSERNDTYSFVPGTGFVLGLYNNYYKGIAPRLGLSYSPLADDSTVLRGLYGRFYDVPGMVSMASGTTANGGAAYSQNNPAGPDAAVIYQSSTLGPWQAGVNPFVGTGAPPLGAFGVDPNIRMSYADEYSLNVEQKVGRKTLLTMGYVLTEGRNLPVLKDINQPLVGTGVRPVTTISSSLANVNPNFVGVGLNGVNQLQGGASANYNALQVNLRQAEWKGFSGVLNYTWSKSMDDASSVTTPMNSYNLHQDYGPSTFDGRNNVNGYVFYTVPQWFHAVPKLTQGWQLNALYQYSSGTPLNPLVSGDNSKTLQLKDRPNVNLGVNPYTGLILATSTASARSYRWLQNTGTFTVPTAGTYGNERRDAFLGPNFRTIDFSLFKNTPITERVRTQFRAEIFNIFNFNNFANPSVSNIASTSFGTVTQTRNGSGAPGIGFGEPFNVQFAFKVSF